MRALDRDGKPFELEADGLLAVCIQHEIDHLDGKLFVDYLSELKRNRIRKKLEKEKRRPCRRREADYAGRDSRAQLMPTDCASSLPARRSSRCRRCRHCTTPGTRSSRCTRSPTGPPAAAAAGRQPREAACARALGLPVEQPATLKTAGGARPVSRRTRRT